MPLPPRPFYSPFEIATRWECDVADIIDWGVAGALLHKSAKGFIL